MDACFHNVRKVWKCSKKPSPGGFFDALPRSSFGSGGGGSEFQFKRSPGSPDGGC